MRYKKPVYFTDVTQKQNYFIFFSLCLRCEYDNLTLSSIMEDETVVCGDLNTKLKTINWISDLNIAVLRLRTDGSINKPGFSLIASIYRCK